MSNLIDYIPAHVREYLESQDKSITQGLQFIANLEGEDTFILADQQLESVEKTARILRGFLYLRYRETCDGRNFLAFLAKRDVPQRTAYDYMSEASTYARLPNSSVCATIAQLQQTKIRALASLPDDDFEAFLDGRDVFGITIDNALAVSAEEFKEKVSAYKKQLDAENNTALNDLKTKLKTVENQRDELLKEREHRRIDGELPDRFITNRVESRAQAYQAGLCLDSLEAVAVDVLEDLKNAENPTDQHYAEAAAASLYSHVLALAARATALEQLLIHRLPQAVVGTEIPPPVYTRDEIEIAVQRERSLRDEHTTEQVNRELDRQVKKSKALKKKAG